MSGLLPLRRRKGKCRYDPSLHAYGPDFPATGERRPDTPDIVRLCPFCPDGNFALALRCSSGRRPTGRSAF